MTSIRTPNSGARRSVPQNFMPSGSLTSGWGAGSIGTAAGFGSGPFDQLVRRMTGGTGDLFSVDPAVRRAVAFDQASLASLANPERAMVTQTFDVTPEQAAVLQRRGVPVQGADDVSSAYNSTRRAPASQIDRLVRQRERSQLYRNPGTDLLQQLFGSFLNFL